MTTSSSGELSISEGKTNEAKKLIYGKSFENYQVLQKYENPTTIFDHLTDVTVIQSSAKTFVVSNSSKRLKNIKTKTKTHVSINKNLVKQIIL